MNRLAQETSPYLLQHADNPVDWYAWSDEALGRARAEDRRGLGDHPAAQAREQGIGIVSRELAQEGHLLRLEGLLGRPYRALA